MSNRIYYETMNGDIPWTEWEADCKLCGKYIHESYPHEVDEEDDVICMDCAYIRGYISEKEYLERTCFWHYRITRAVIHEGKIYLADDSKLPWERANKDERKTLEYKNWRKAVFERDSYKCAICGKVGGELNAHHIKSFSKYPKLRFDIDNGITLCKPCHVQVHKEKKDAGIYFRKQNNSK